MASLWSKPTPEPHKDEADVADTGLAVVGLSPAASVSMGRPSIQRNQPQPPPPHQPPPPPGPQQIIHPDNSLSLMQLRKIVTEFPNAEPTSYTFTYSDTATYEEEVDEWFSYNNAEFKRLDRAKNTFARRWKKHGGKPWLEASREQRKEFLKLEVDDLRNDDLRRRCKSLQSILHVVLGVWSETAGLKQEDEMKEKGNKSDGNEKESAACKTNPKTKATKLQLEHMREGMSLVGEVGGISMLYEVLRNAFKRFW
jgi:hypothetical protein